MVRRRNRGGTEKEEKFAWFLLITLSVNPLIGQQAAAFAHYR